MYDRAPRVLVATAPANSTPATLGPGVYWKGNNEIRIGYAPFLSLTKRESFLTIPDQVAVAPGPGEYTNDKSHKEKIKGGSTLQNRSRRFESSSSLAPGPGSYSIKSSLPKKTVERKPTYPLTSRTRKISRSRITYSRMKTAPSIPFPGKSYGYEEDNGGQLVAKEGPEKDTSLGPTYYDISNNDIKVGKKYKGTQFSKLKSQRYQFKGKDGPAPCHYTPKLTHKETSVTVPKPSALLPRYHEIIPQIEEKKGIPGPGKYQLPSQFPEAVDSHVIQPPFGVTTQRFVESYMYPLSPAPTKYNDPRTAFDSLKRVSGLTKSPFGQTSARFRPDRKSMEIPGPGSYNDSKAISLAFDAMRKANAPGMKHNAFGTTSARTVPMTKRDDHYMPGPAMYQQDNLPSPTRSDQGTSAFKSSLQRLPSPPAIVKDIPPPGAYEVVDSYHKIHGRVDTKKHTLNSAFMSSNSRFVPPRDIQLNETDSENPGPGMYNPDTKLRMGTNQNGLLCSKGERFKTPSPSDLGPGSYQFCKSHTDTVLKGTFNATLGNPLNEEDEDASMTPALSSRGHPLPSMTAKQTIILST